MMDLIHAENNDKWLQLFRIHIVAVTASKYDIIYMVNMAHMTTAAFLHIKSSVIHFRHDFPIKNEF